MGDVCGYSVKPYRYLGPRQAPGEAEQSPEHDRNLFRSSRPGPGKIWWAARGLYYRGPERSHPSLHTLRRSLCSAGAAITEVKKRLGAKIFTCTPHPTVGRAYDGAVPAACDLRIR